MALIPVTKDDSPLDQVEKYIDMLAAVPDSLTLHSQVDGGGIPLPPSAARDLLGGFAKGAIRCARAELETISAEVEKLRDERQPFRVLMDAAMERDLAEGIVDTAVLDLAERLGFPPLPIRVRTMVRVQVMDGVVVGRVVSIRAPLALPPGADPRFRITLLRPDEVVD